MRSYDLTPLYRNSVGLTAFSICSIPSANWKLAATRLITSKRVAEDDYRITLAVAGFSESELDITVHENTLTVVGKRPVGDENRTFLHQGIAGRSF